jgi:hypothetical protein
MLLAVIMLLYSTIGISEALSKNTKDRVDAYNEANGLLEKGQYEKARSIVDKYYSSEDIKFSLLSAELYFIDEKYKEALKAVNYLSRKYWATLFVENEGPIETDNQKGMMKNYFEILGLEFASYHRLENWQEAARVGKLYIQFLSKEDKEKLSVGLGEIYIKAARNYLAEAEKIFSDTKNSKNVDFSEYSYFNLGIINSLNNKYSEAKDNILKCLEITKHRSDRIKYIKNDPLFKPILRDENFSSALK